MATYTTHYNLKKPALADKIRISDFNGNADIIDGQMYDNETLGAQLKADIGIVENTNTATHNISAGQYVIWKGSLYTASSAISTGATLSDANLTAVSGGGLNALNSKLSSESSWIEIVQGSTACFATIHNGIIFVRGHSFGGITIGGGSGYVALATLPERYRPVQTLYFPVGWSGSGLNMQIGSDGVISFAGDAKTYWNYFVSYPF